MTYQELQKLVETVAQANRTFTNAEFESLERNSDGDIIELASCFFLISETQRDGLSEDDYSRMDNYEEDMRCMMEEFS